MSYELETCEAMEELIALDAGGDLEDAEKQRLEDHLTACPACRDFAAEMAQSRQAVRRLAGVAVGRDVLAGVRSVVLQEIESDRWRPGSLLWFPRALPGQRRWLAAAAAILLTAGVGWWLAGRPDQVPAPLPEIVRHEPPLPAPPGEPPAIAEPPAVAEMVEPRIASPVEPPPPATPPLEPGPLTARPTPVAVAAAGRPQDQPMIVKWIVDDPDLVIYWLIDTDEATEETTDEPKKA